MYSFQFCFILFDFHGCNNKNQQSHCTEQRTFGASDEEIFHIGSLSDGLELDLFSSSMESLKMARKREARPLISLVMNVLETLQESAKIDVHRAKERESFRSFNR